MLSRAIVHKFLIHRTIVSVFKRPAAQRCFSNGNTQYAEDDDNGIDRDTILSSALQYVPEYGWSIKALQYGATLAGLPGVTHGLFPRGGGDLIEYFEMDCNNRLIEYLKEATTGEQLIKGGRLVHQAVETRLRMLSPYIDTWSEAMAIKTYPNNLSSSLERFATMVDDIWYYTGDRSTDFNWYTKRGILAAVYCTTEIYMVQDKSVDFQDTWNFLQRRIDDTKTITNARQQLDGLVGGAFEFGTAAFTTIRNMIGLNSRYR